MNVIAQLFGIIAITLWIFSIQKNNKKDILFFQVGANMFYVILYIILGAYSGAFTNVVSTSKGLIYYEYEKQNKKIPKYWLFIFLIIIAGLGIITLDGILSLIPTIIAASYIVSTWQKNLKIIRIVYILAAIAWIYYNFMVGAYICILGNILEIISGVISIIKNKVKE